jgi:DNA polymerase-3 subunit gamma/tau
MLVAAVGCEANLMLLTPPAEFQDFRRQAEQLGLETLLAMLQILDQALTRMRQSSQHRLLMEVALVRLCHLEQLDELTTLLTQLQSTAGGPSAGPGAATRRGAVEPPARQEKKTDQPADPPVTPALPLSATPETAETIWKQALANMEDMASVYGAGYAAVATPAPNRLVVTFPPGYTLQKEGCERPERKARIEQALSRITGREMRVDFELLEDTQPALRKQAPPPPTHRQRLRQVEQQPFVRRAMELFDAEVTRLEESRARK